MGNLRSVQKACEKLGAAAEITSSAREISTATHLILPGVGAFRDAIHELKRQDLVGVLRDYLASERPFLGICLGLQLLFDVSEEDGEWDGLGVIPGRVTRFSLPPEFKIPHMGWNQLLPPIAAATAPAPSPEPALAHPVLGHLSRDASVYFVHSYHVVPTDRGVIAAECDYGGRFVAAIAQGSLVATQFHPEKSQQAGLELLRRFSRLPSPCSLTTI